MRVGGKRRPRSHHSCPWSILRAPGPSLRPGSSESLTQWGQVQTCTMSPLLLCRHCGRSGPHRPLKHWKNAGWRLAAQPSQLAFCRQCGRPAPGKGGAASHGQDSQEVGADRHSWPELTLWAPGPRRPAMHGGDVTVGRR